VDDNALFLPPENIDGLLMILKLTVLIKNKQTSCKIDTGVFLILYAWPSGIKQLFLSTLIFLKECNVNYNAFLRIGIVLILVLKTEFRG